MNDTEKAARGRPRGFDAAAGIAAAQSAFHARGYDAVGVADLCATLGIRPPSLYAAYGSKRGLFDAAVARYGAETSRAFADAMDGVTRLADLRPAILRTALDLYLRDGGIGCLVLANMTATADDDVRAALADVIATRRAAMAAKARTLGASDEEARTIVDAIAVTMMGLSAAARAGMDRAALEAVLDRLG